MKRVLILASLLLVAATTVNTSTFVQDDTFFLGSDEFLVRATLEDAVDVLTPAGGRILRVDDCVYNDTARWCVASSSNASASLELLYLDKELELSRTVPSSVTVGEQATVSLLLDNTGELPLSISLVEHTNASVDSSTGFTDSLSWSGVLDVGDSEEFSYSFTAVRAQELVFAANVSGDASAADEESVSVEDFVDVEASYTKRPTRGHPYNFSVEVSGSADGEEAEVLLVVPDGLRVEDSSGFRTADEGFLADAPLNASSSFSLTYVLERPAAGPFELFVTTTRNDTEVVRPYSYPLNASPFLPLRLSPDFVNASLLVNESRSFSVEVFNDNVEDVQAAVSVSSVLANVEESVSVPANGSSSVSFEVVSNRSNEYGFLVEASYVDANGDDLSERVFVPVRSREPVPDPIVPSASVSGPVLLSENESGVLTLSLRDAPSGGGLLVWSRDGEVVHSSQVAVFSNASYQLPISAPGRYVARLNVSNESLSASYGVSAPANRSPVNASSRTPAESSGSGWLFFTVLVLFLGGGLLVWRVRASRVEQQELLELLAVLRRVRPASGEQARARDEAVASLIRRLEEKS